MDSPDVSQLPASGPNAPASGSYGAKAATDKLRMQLGEAQGVGTPPPPPPPDVSALPPRPPAQHGTGPAGIPTAILSPTSRPNVAPQTPLMQPVNPVAMAQTNRDGRIAIWTALAESPEVSDETRELARSVLRSVYG